MFLRKNSLSLRKQWTRKIAARIAVLGLVVGLTSLGRPSEAHGQERFSIEGRSGTAVPASDLANLQDVGPSVGVVYRLEPRVSLRLDGDVDILSGVVWVPVPSTLDFDDATVPVRRHRNIYRHTTGLEVKVFDSETSPLDANLGDGASTLDFDDFTVAGTPIDFTETYFTATGGLKLGYRRDQRTTHCHPERG